MNFASYHLTGKSAIGKTLKHLPIKISYQSNTKTKDSGAKLSICLPPYPCGSIRIRSFHTFINSPIHIYTNTKACSNKYCLKFYTICFHCEKKKVNEIMLWFGKVDIIMLFKATGYSDKITALTITVQCCKK